MTDLHTFIHLFNQVLSIHESDIPDGSKLPNITDTMHALANSDNELPANIKKFVTRTLDELPRGRCIVPRRLPPGQYSHAKWAAIHHRLVERTSRQPGLRHHAHVSAAHVRAENPWAERRGTSTDHRSGQVDGRPIPQTHARGHRVQRRGVPRLAHHHVLVPFSLRTEHRA